MFPHVYMAKVIVSIILYLLYYLIRIILLQEYNTYVDNIKICNEWILIHSLNNYTKFIPNDAIVEALYIKTIYPILLSELHYLFTLLPKSKISQLFSDVRGDFLYEFFPSKKMKHIYLQFYDRSVDPLTHLLFPNTVKYIHDIPTSYCCKLFIIHPHTSIEFPNSSFKGVITTFMPIFANNCIIGINSKDISDNMINVESVESVESGEIKSVDPTCDYFIHNKSKKYALFLSCTFMRACINQYGTLLLSLCDRLALLTSRFKYEKQFQ